MNDTNKLIVNQGTVVKLARIGADFHGDHASHKQARKEIKCELARLDQLQYLLYSENKNSLLIVLQGMDAAGKDGVIRHVLGGMNPQGCSVAGFKQPTVLEASHDFLWRAHCHVPRTGEVGIFNRSHYEDVLVTRAHKLISEKECLRRYTFINEFERLIFQENKTTILKFFLHISKKEQLKRFGQRLNDPDRRWKISENDYHERLSWKGYMQFYEQMLSETSKKHAPWFIIPSDHKWFRNLAVSRIIANTLEGLKMKAPQATVDIEEIRRKYHAAEKKEKSLKDSAS